jgi:mono/diheme cytochrome c family protein
MGQSAAARPRYGGDMKIAGVLLAVSSVFLVAPAASAEDSARGKLLYETHCGTCHYERVHQRVRPSVRDLDQLRDMVARWVPQARHRFTLDEQEAVVQYLNESHYRFGLPPRPKKGS